jgi:flagellar hook-associated protein 3 FlgL
VPGGNGQFSVAADAGNAGTAAVAAGSVADIAAFAQHDYSIQFTGPNTFDVVDDTLAVTVLAGQPYTDGDAVQFDGISTSISGQPAAGDQFYISPSVAQSPFETLQRFIDTMGVDPTTPAENAKVHQAMNDVIDSLDQAVDHVLGVRATVGSRQSALEAVGRQTDDVAFELGSTLSQLEDLDATAAISTLQQRISALEAMQRTFVSVASLSLFDFLR